MSDNKAIPPAYPAASILLIRDGRTGMEVLMMERAKTMRFAPGAFVFPGGKVDQQDTQLWRWKRYLKNERTVPKDFAFRIAALRELHEEVDIVLSNNPMKATLSKSKPFEAALIEQNAQLSLNAMVPFAHWVTPETMPRRFDTHFYLAEDIGHYEKHDGNEAISARWVKPREILADWAADQIPLMFPTRLNLMKLARSSTVKAALLASKQAPVVRILPEFSKKGRKIDLTILQNSGYDVSEATERELSVETVKS
ncbi:NUDIX hydrolase [Kordiimonas aquimaris]|uniref:NUDIX hydrolase n=1 Tax=Kordiimonas aquimaris TaxID=707591 RepID=UPI0021CFC881|nr:NUDIX hydrolase [Kordiimonas aquimaris]